MCRPLALVAATCALFFAHVHAQQPALPPPPPDDIGGPTIPARPPLAIVPVDVIQPPPRPLPGEQESSAVTRFSFIAYGDTRGGARPPDGDVLHPIHSQVADAMLAKAQALENTSFPVRFILHSGDAVLRGFSATQWNVSFSPIVSRLTAAGLPYFFVTGNHDIGMRPAGSPERALGMHNLLTAMSRLIPAEGSARRLAGYATYAVAFGNTFVIALDSNVARDPIQLLWVTEQLERRRFVHVIALVHHPPYSSGPHGGDLIEPESEALRELYMPLFRRHHVRMIIAGHEHLYEHWIERFVDGGASYRLDVVVSGGGGAPVYGYRAEPDLQAYVEAAGAANVQVEHRVKPALVRSENPHHFVVIQVDGERLSLEVVPIGELALTPYEGRSQVELSDPPPSEP